MIEIFVVEKMEMAEKKTKIAANGKRWMSFYRYDLMLLLVVIYSMKIALGNCNLIIENT